MKSLSKGIEEYYRWHAPLYDMTRWSFLFGRKNLVTLATSVSAPVSVLEVGCGTGHMIRQLVRMVPRVRVTGMDASPEMLARCKKKLTGYPNDICLVNRLYTSPFSPENPQDMVLFSYSLSMFGNSIGEAVSMARRDLRAGGLIAVTDFHDTSYAWFRRWMSMNHVAIDGTILPLLQKEFSTSHCRITSVYGGLWSYFQYVGRKVD